MSETSPYKEIIESIIQKHVTVLGGFLALQQARRVHGLEVDDAGKVNIITGDPIVILNQLVHQYQGLLGDAGMTFSRNAALPIIKKNPNIALPAALREVDK